MDNDIKMKDKPAPGNNPFVKKEESKLKEDEDFSVKEEDEEPLEVYDLFLSETCRDQVYLFRFPLRPKMMGNGMDECEKFEFKKEHQKCRITYKVEMDEHYERSHFYDIDELDGEEEEEEMNLDIEKDDDSYEEEKKKEGKKKKKTKKKESVPKIVYESQIESMKNNYAIGVKRGNQIHITPVHNVLTFQPSFDLYGKVPEMEQSQTEKEKVPNDAKKKKKKMNMNFHLTSFEEEQRKNLWEQIKQTEELNEYEKYEYHLPQEQSTDTKIESLIHQEMDDDVRQFLSKEKFANKLFPPHEEDNHLNYVDLENDIDTMEEELRGMTLVDVLKSNDIDIRVRYLFKNGHIFTVNEVVNILNIPRSFIIRESGKIKNESPESQVDLLSGKEYEKRRERFFSSLMKYSHYLEKYDVYVSKSYLYKKKFDKLEMFVRDCLIDRFLKKDFISRKKFHEFTKNKIKSDVLKEIFKQISVMKKAVLMWKIKKVGPNSKVLNDDDSLNMIDGILEERKDLDLPKEFLKLNNEELKKIKENVKITIRSNFKSFNLNKGGRTRSHIEKYTNVGSSGDQDRQKELMNFFFQEFRTYGALTKDELIKHYKTIWQANNDVLKSVENSNFEEFFKHFCRIFYGDVYILKNITKVEWTKKIRNAMIDVFLKKNCEPMDPPEILKGITEILKCESNKVKTGDFLRIVSELAIVKNQKWVPKKGVPEKIDTNIWKRKRRK